MKSVFLITFFLLITVKQDPLFAQEYIYKHFTTADGLPSSEVYHVFQDSKGYIWLATDNGVSKYNGYEFESFDMNDGLATNSISEVYEDHEGRIWFIGMNTKLSYYKNNKIVKFKYNNKFSSLFNYGQVPLKSSFYVDSLDNIYIGVVRGGVYKINTIGQIKRKHDRPHYIELYKPIDDKIIASYRYTSTKDIEIEIYNDSSSVKLMAGIDEDIISGNHVFAVKESEKSMLVTVSNCVFRIKNNKIELLKEANKFIQFLYKDYNGNFWICYSSGGVEKLSTRNGLISESQFFFKKENISSVLLDNNNGLWVSTLKKGVYYLPSKALKRLSTKNVIDISPCTKSIYFIDGSDTVSNLSLENKTVRCNVINSEINKCIFHDTVTHNTYVGSRNWTYFIRKDEKVEVVKNNHHTINPRDIGHTYFNANTMLMDGDSLWIAGGNGFFKLINNKVIIDSRFDKNFIMRVNAICKIGSSIYFGTEHGLVKFENGKINTFAIKDSLLGKRILDIVRKNEQLILATKGAGILFKNKNNVKQITKKHGLNNNTVNCLLLIDNVLWSGSANGLNKTVLSEKNGELLPVNTISIPELNGFEIRKIVLVGKKIYFATNEGLIEFEPGFQTFIMEQVPLHIINLKTNNVSREVKNNMMFSYDENNLQINYEALYYKRPNAVNYRYKLIGLDKNWVYTKERQARYYYLNPAKYTFIVEVQNENKEWVTNSAKIDFEIIPAFWQTIYFKIAVTLLIFSGLLLLFKARQISSKHKLHLKQQVYNYMNQAMKAQIHPHFIFNTLNSINKFILTNNKRSASLYLIKFSKLIRKVLEHSQKENILLADELSALELYLSIEAMRLKGSFTYSVKIGEDVEVNNVLTPSLLLQPFVENSIWHGIQPLDKKGVIKIRISRNGTNLEAEIIDNGVGREKAGEIMQKRYPNKKSAGIRITRKRLDLLAKKLNSQTNVEYTDLYSRNISIGTKVKISLPLISIEKSENNNLETIN